MAAVVPSWRSCTGAVTRRAPRICAHSELLMCLLPSAEPALLEDCSGWWLVVAGMEAGKQARKYGNRSSQIQGKWGHADVRNEDQGEREREKNPEVFFGVFSHQQDGRGNTLY